MLLVKPQFEAGRARVGKGGIVRDPAVHRAVLGEVRDGLAAPRPAHGRGRDASPLQGADGNVEFLFHVAKAGPLVDDAGSTSWSRRRTRRRSTRSRSRSAREPPSRRSVWSRTATAARRARARQHAAAWLAEHGIEVRVPADDAEASGLDARRGAATTLRRRASTS